MLSSISTIAGELDRCKIPHEGQSYDQFTCSCCYNKKDLLSTPHFWLSVSSGYVMALLIVRDI